MDLEFWQKEWDALAAAPVLAIFALLIAAAADYWFRRSISIGEIKGLKAHLDTKKNDYCIGPRY